MHMIFDVNHQGLQHKARLVVGGHVVDPVKHNTHIFIYHQIFVCETNAIDSREKWVRNHGWIYWR